MNKHFFTITGISLILMMLLWEADPSGLVRVDWRTIHQTMPLTVFLLFVVLIGIAVYILNIVLHRLVHAQMKQAQQIAAAKRPEPKSVEIQDQEKAVQLRAEIDEAMINLLEAMTAITAGDMAAARASLATLKKTVGNDTLADVLMLKVYKGEKDFDSLEALSAKLAQNPQLQLVSLKSSIEAHLQRKENDRALADVNKAYAIRPDLYWVFENAFALRAQAEDWDGVLQVLNDGLKNNLVTDEKYHKAKAVALYQLAIKARENGDHINFFKFCQQALNTCKTLTPAAIDLARYYVENDQQIRKAEQILKSAWRCNPTSEIAEAYLNLYPNDTAVQKVQRMEKLAHMNSRRPYLNNLLLAELDLNAELWGKAKAEFEIFLINNPATKKMARLIADFEEKSNNNKKAAEKWRLKASDCPSDSVWMCEDCRHISAKWLPICKKCGSVGRYAWRLYKHQK